MYEDLHTLREGTVREQYQDEPREVGWGELGRDARPATLGFIAYLDVSSYLRRLDRDILLTDFPTRPPSVPSMATIGRNIRGRNDTGAGHKTRAVFDRYNIVNEQELLTAGERLATHVTRSGA